MEIVELVGLPVEPELLLLLAGGFLGPVGDFFGEVGDVAGDAAGAIGGAAEDVGGAVVDAADFAKEKIAPIAGTVGGFAVGGPGGAAAGGSIGQAVSNLGEGGQGDGRTTAGERVLRPTVRGVQQSAQRAERAAQGAQVGTEAGAAAETTRQRPSTLRRMLDDPLVIGGLVLAAVLILGN